MKPKNSERKKIKSNSSQSFPYLICSFILFHQNKRQKHTYHVKRFHSCSNGQELTLTKPLTHTPSHVSFSFCSLRGPFCAPFSPTPRNGVTSARKKMIPPSSVYVERARERDSLVVFFLAGRVFLGCSSEMKKSKNQSCYEKIICTLKRVIHTHTHTY